MVAFKWLQGKFNKGTREYTPNPMIKVDLHAWFFLGGQQSSAGTPDYSNHTHAAYHGHATCDGDDLRGLEVRDECF